MRIFLVDEKNCDVTVMKKVFVLVAMILFIFPTFCLAATLSKDITNRTRDENKNVGNVSLEDDGKWKYPLVGASAGATYYLDTTSCTYWITENIATVACIIYTGGRGAAPDGGPAKISKPIHFQFDTYKTKDGRKIFFKSVNGTISGERFNHWLEWDNGFLLGLFWKVAKYSELIKYLD